MADLPKSAEIVIIGGGVIGLSIAAHLAWRGAKDVVLVERNQLTSGTSWHAAGIIGPLRASLSLTRLSVYATELFPKLERDTGQSTGYRRTGGLWLAQTADRMTELRRTADIGLLAGLQARMADVHEIAERVPLVDTGGLAGGLWVEEDGQANPVDVCMAYARAARAHGVTVCENAPVATVLTKAGTVAGVEMADGRQIACRAVVNCAGAWARGLAARSGIAVPLQAVEHMYVVSEPVAGLPQPFPILRDLDARIYVKEDAGKLVLGGFESDAKPIAADAPGMGDAFLELPEDWDQFEPFMLAGLRRIPALNDCGIQHFMNGPESFTPDTRQLMGEAPECRNYFVAAGFNSLGIVSSAGAGRVMADWVLDGAAPMDVFDLDIARFEPDMAAEPFLRVRVREAVANQFDMHWPYKRVRTGRDLRRLPAHDVWVAQGGMFDAPAGWERPMWFSDSSQASAVEDSYGDQPWWPAAEAECRAARDAAVLIDLSPFSKIEAAGPDTFAHLQRAATADVDVVRGRAVYSLFLNDDGGIEADATVLRLNEDRFMIIGPAPWRRRDLMRLERHFPDGTLRDRTRELAVLGLMGPNAVEVWKAAGGSGEALTLGYGHSAVCTVAGLDVRALRISYIGEFGWEIYVAWNRAAELAQALLTAGEPYGLRPMGLHAVDCCRMEKGFRHFGHDLGPEDTPFSAGLGFAVARNKAGGFIGQDRLSSVSDPDRRLLQFSVDGAHPLLLHDEPVFRDGQLAGHTTSGARGFRTDLSLCLAQVATPDAETITDLAHSRFEISVAGRRHPLTLHRNPPYDPTGARMRATSQAEP